MSPTLNLSVTISPYSVHFSVKAPPLLVLKADGEEFLEPGNTRQLKDDWIEGLIKIFNAGSSTTKG